MPAADPAAHARASTWLRRWLWFVALESAVFVGIYVYGGWFAESSFPFVTNSAAKDLLFVCLASLAAVAPRRHSAALALVLYGHVVIVALNLIEAVFTGPPRDVGTFDPAALDPGTMVWVWPAAATLAVIVPGFLLRRAERRAFYGLKYLSYGQFVTLAALADVVIEGTNELIGPHEIAHRVDAYLDGFRSRAKVRIKLALIAMHVYPLLVGRPPLHQMDYDYRRLFLERHFERLLDRRLLPRWLRGILQSAVRGSQQMIFVGYYGHPAAAEAVGYKRFSQREAGGGAEPLPRLPLRVLGPDDVEGERLATDVVVIGSGAAGAIVAHRLAAANRQVLVLERGLHVAPEEFTEDEALQYARLYADGALQLSRDFRFQMLQGSCVGGSTTVNNAVCLRARPATIEQWCSADGLDCGLTADELDGAYTRVEDLMRVTAQPPDGPLNRSGEILRAGLYELGQLDPPNEFSVVSANITDCLGCGYCNIGCFWGRKLSALDHVLPLGQAPDPSRLQILAQCRVEKIEHRDGRATGVVCRLGDDGRRLRVSAHTVVLAAGAIGSSLILQRSGIGGDRVGVDLACNMGVPLVADFEREVRAFEGLQIGHVFAPPPERRFAFESWFNPVMAQALVMPGWFRDHWNNMQRYTHLAGAGCVVGTAGSGRVSRGRFGGPDFSFTVSRDDAAVMVEGLKLLGRAFFAAGARRVLPSTFDFHDIRSPAGLDVLDEYATSPDGLFVNSAHPQGGNALGGVVSAERFLVEGMRNVHVADASVFPSSITVNPQLTVMALADLAAERIGAGA